MNEQVEKYLRDEFSIGERLKFLKKLASDRELQAEFSEYQNMQALLSFSDAVQDGKESSGSYRSFMQRIKRRRVRKMSLRITGYAAAIAFITLSVHLYHVSAYSPYMPAPKDVSFFVPASQRINMTLPDGTLVWLNAQTKLTYPTEFTGEERRVEIEGEAYLEVAEDAERPFIISSNGMEIKVLGTAFNIYSYPEEAISRVCLLEGSLQVSFPSAKSDGVILKPDEQLIIRGNEVSVETIPHADYFLWTEGIYSFHNEPLDNILKRLELYYDIQIEVKDPSILDWKYTGKFRQRDGIDEILILMQQIRAFRVVKDKENNKITLSK